jgi:translocator protein
MMGSFQWQKALLLAISTAAAAAVGSFGTSMRDQQWFGALDQPAFYPPEWLFGPVWTALYVAMTVAAYRAWTRASGSDQVRLVLLLFYGQLMFNAAWSVVFFAFEAILLALVVIVVLLILVAATMVRFYRIDTAAGWLFLPYLLWVAFATALNAAIVWLNPAQTAL